MHVSAQDVSREETILTPPALTGLLEWLDDGANSHGERYLEMHRRLVSYFDRHNRLSADALADETFRRVAGTLEQTGATATTPARYCYDVAKLVLLEDLRRDRRTGVDGTLPAGAARSAGIAGADTGPTSRAHSPECLDRCMEELRPDERELIVEYYRDARRQGADVHRRMAQRMGISEHALGMRAVRIRETLMNRVTSWKAAR